MPGKTRPKITRCFLLMILGMAMGCSHTYYFEPSLERDPQVAARTWRGGIIYPIPADQEPEFKVKILTLGLVAAPSKNFLNQEQMLLVRFLIQRSRPLFVPPEKFEDKDEEEFFDPFEQIVHFPDGITASPILVHAESKRKPLIQISPRSRQTIDLYFELPKNIKSGADLPNFSLDWKIHYRNRKFVAHSTHFERTSTPPKDGSASEEPVSGDPFDFYDSNLALPADWAGTEWLWWYPSKSSKADQPSFWP